MVRHRKLSGSSDYSDASDKSSELPPSFNCAGSKPEEIIQRKLQTVDSFKRTMEELQSEYERNLTTLSGQIKKLNDFTDEIESVHKKATVGSFVGASVGAVGGIAGLAGLALAPFTFGASLSLSAVGAVAGAVGGAASNIINMVKQSAKLRPTVEKIITDFLETIKPMTKPLNIISNITADIPRNKLKLQTPARGFDDSLKIAKVHCKKKNRKIMVKSLAAKMPTTSHQMTVKNLNLLYKKKLFENGYLP